MPSPSATIRQTVSRPAQLTRHRGMNERNMSADRGARYSCAVLTGAQRYGFCAPPLTKYAISCGGGVRFTCAVPSSTLTEPSQRTSQLDWASHLAQHRPKERSFSRTCAGAEHGTLGRPSSCRVYTLT